MLSVDWFDELGTTLAMGTRALDGPLFLRDEDFARDLAWKAELLRDRHAEVFAARDTPAVRAASAEIRELVSAQEQDLPALTQVSMHPLEIAGRGVQEDLCVIVLRDGGPHLDAACLCFPSYWRLADKLGRPLADVHAPVPAYASDLASKVDSFLTRLAPGRMVWRRNWSIHDDPAYFLPVSGAPRADLRVPDDLFLRSERQVLRALDTPNTVLFTIRTQQVPLALVDTRPDVARRLAGIIDAWSDDMREYKDGHGAVAARDWLATRG
jgi:dimethylamine monooxygenase subunit A